MTHRRLFLEATAGALGAAALTPLVRLDRVLAQTRSELQRDLGVVEPGSDDFGRRVREEYLLSPEITYLNHASIGTIPRAVHEAHIAYLAVCETNPWLYMWGGAWEDSREAVR
ncbi:MAG: hypothetical protein R3266_11925, partial [Gemmatimonadota bacterium]|nr:hypothetical protein [Gemmatimonadota bacterium]